MRQNNYLTFFGSEEQVSNIVGTACSLNLTQLKDVLSIISSEKCFEHRRLVDEGSLPIALIHFAR